jgi:hypothetical protein
MPNQMDSLVNHMQYLTRAARRPVLSLQTAFHRLVSIPPSFFQKKRERERLPSGHHIYKTQNFQNNKQWNMPN